MPSNDAVWGIEIGQSALKALRLRYAEAAHQVVAVAFDYIPYAKILSQPDADAPALVDQAMNQFLSRNDLRGDRVVIAVPGQSGLVRFIKLPPIESKKIPEIVRYEARQQIPFPLEEVLWDYQQMGGGIEEGGFALETEVGLFAMKRDQVQHHLVPFLNAGVEVDVVQMSPLALFNFYVYDRLGGDGQQQQSQEKDFILLLEVGTESTNLVVTNGQQVWQRAVPLGGSHFTRALSREMKLTFAKAEHMKCNATTAPDPRAVFQAMRPVFNDLVTELERSIGYFRSVHRGCRITQILGIGNGFKLPGLQKYISQNLQTECRRLDGFSSLVGAAVLESPVFKENILSFAVAYGLGVQGLELGKLQTSLVPPEIEQARLIRRKKPWVVAAAAALILGLFTSFFGSWRAWSRVHADTWTVTSSAEALVKDANTKRSDFNSAKRSWQATDASGQGLAKIVETRADWLALFRAINVALPRDANMAAPPEDISKRHQIHLTMITCEQWNDLAQWYSTVPAHAVESMIEEDQETAPRGPGKVVRLTGHHFHHEPEKQQLQTGLYVKNTLMENLRKPFIKRGKEDVPVAELGISHVALVSDIFREVTLGYADPDPLNPTAPPAPVLGVRTDFVVQFVWQQQQHSGELSTDGF